MIEPLNSAEVRWFGTGEAPPALAGRFAAVEAEAREDRYLAVRDCTVLGVKLREGRFEIKARVRELGRVEAGPVCGRGELWTKLSIAVEGLRLGDELLGVRKQRRLRTFAVAGGGLREAAGERLEDGCGVELTEVSDPRGGRWWSLGLEAFGRDPEATLRETLRLFFREPPERVELAPAASMSYPAWLARFL